MVRACTPEPWPEDLLKRSYFMMGICGDGTDRPCPDPALPMPANGSGYINPDGKLVLPEGVELPKIVPFERGKLRLLTNSHPTAVHNRFEGAVLPGGRR